MKTRFVTTLGDGVVKSVAFAFCMLIAISAATAQNSLTDGYPYPYPHYALSASLRVVQLPRGITVVARVPLNGEPVSGMYTQREYGHTYLYIERAQQNLTTVDVTKKRNPRLVDHQPARLEPIRYEELFEGGSIEVSPRRVHAGVNNRAGEMISPLQKNDPNDAALLRALGQGSSNLVDRDSRLVYFASPLQLLIVQDKR